MDQLMAYFLQRPDVRRQFESIVGSDVAIKLFRQSGRESEMAVADLIYDPQHHMQSMRRAKVPMPPSSPGSLAALFNSNNSSAKAMFPDTMTAEAKQGEQEHGNAAAAAAAAAFPTQSNGDVEMKHLAADGKTENKMVAVDTWLFAPFEYRVFTHFKASVGCAAREAHLLLARGRMRYVRQQGTVIVRQNEFPTCLSLLISGSVGAFTGDNNSKSSVPQYTVHPLMWLSAVAFLECSKLWVSSPNSGEKQTAGLLDDTTSSLSATAAAATVAADVNSAAAMNAYVSTLTLRALEPASFISWDFEDLQALCAHSERLQFILGQLISLDISAKFLQQRQQPQEQQQQQQQVRNVSSSLSSSLPSPPRAPGVLLPPIAASPQPPTVINL
jgi:hypothetical protein